MARPAHVTFKVDPVQVIYDAETDSESKLVAAQEQMVAAGYSN